MINTVLYQKLVKVSTALFIFCVTFFFTYRLYRLIDKNAINVLFYDQWDFLVPIFNQRNAWTIFSQQHGPHREGIGLIITQWLYNATAWDVRAESFMLFAFMLVALLIAFRVTYVINNKTTHAADFLLPMIFLTPRHYETFVGTPNIGYSVLPVLMMTLYAATMLVSHIKLRVIAIVLLNFLLLYSGFGLFVGVLTPVLLLFYSFSDSRNRPAYFMGIIGCALATILFFYNYRWTPAVSCFHFPDENPLSYIRYMSIMWGSFWGYRYDIQQDNLVINVFSLGFCLLLLCLYAVFYCFREASMNYRVIKPAGLIILFLIGFSAIFTVFTSVGRLCLGLETAGASRYMMLLVPGMWGLYLFLGRNVITERYPFARAIFALIFVVSFLQNDPRYTLEAQDINIRKSKWLACYKSEQDPFKCSAQPGTDIHPNVKSIVPKLEFLKNAKLNLFAD